MHDHAPIHTALLSVSDKTGIVPFAKALVAHNVALLSTGGTAQVLREHDIPVTDISTYTGFPEIMDGRVKTLHPKVHGGILSRRTVDQSIMAEHDIANIDLLVVNLYPFESTIQTPGCTLDAAIEQIDIGGPSLLRAAAKNHQHVTVAVDPQDYDLILEQLKRPDPGTLLQTRRHLAYKAFAHTARYDATITEYLSQQLVPNTQATTADNLPTTLTIQLPRKAVLRYGENPHQAAAFYASPSPTGGTLAAATQLQGKPLSYNNIADGDAALEAVHGLHSEQPACVIVKHANPCGAAIAATQTAAYQRAFATDALSAFGGIIAFNTSVSASTAETILAQQFVEVVLAPTFAPQALAVFAQKPNVRLLACGERGRDAPLPTQHLKQITGGLLLQEADRDTLDIADFKVVSQTAPTAAQLRDLMFAWRLVKPVKSNAIVLVQDQATLGVGAGQMSRIDSLKIANRKAGEAGLSTQGAVLASDAFFPFPDSIEAAAKYGISAIIQPGGSIKDHEVIAAADDADICMVFTGVRHFNH